MSAHSGLQYLFIPEFLVFSKVDDDKYGDGFSPDWQADGIRGVVVIMSTVKRERSMMHKYECSDGRLVPAGNPDKERWYVNVTSTDREKLE